MFKSIVFKFYLVLLGILLVTFIAFGLLIDGLVKDTQIERSKTVVASQIVFHARQLLVPQSFVFGSEYSSRQRFISLLDAVRTSEIVRIKVWDLQSRVIFSDDESLIGQSFPDNEELKKALSGQIEAEIQAPTKLENVSESRYTQLLEVYVPIYFQDSTQMAGVVEAYYNLDAVNSLLSKIRVIIFISMLAITIGIVGAIWFLFSFLVRKRLALLVNAANKTAGGDLDTRVTVLGQDEIGQLAVAFNAMSAKLKELYRGMEQKISERTKELDERVAELEKTGRAMSNLIDDIQEEKTKSQHLATDLEKFKLAVDNVSDNIIITDPEGIVIYANRAIEKATGYKPEEAIGKKSGALWKSPMPEDFYQKLWDTIKTQKKTFIGEIQNKRKNGEIYTAVISISPIINRSGEIEFYVAIERDVSREKEIDKAKSEFVTKLSHEKAKDEAVLSSIGDGLIVTDDKGYITQVNANFEKLLGFSSDEVVGKSMFEVVQKVDENGKIITTEKRSLQRVLSGELAAGTVSTIVKTHSYIRKDKSYLPVVGIVTPIKLDNKIIGAVQVFRDVTHELEIDRAKSEFVSIASHELRTPLTAIDGLVSMILDGEYGEVNQNLRQPLSDVNTSSERLIHLVNDMLSLSRIQAGRLKYTLSDFSISNILTEAVHLLQPLSEQKGLQLTCKINEDFLVQADLDKVKQILNNLIGNSLKFTERGTITVTTYAVNDCVLINIADTGIGISKKDQTLLFGKFQQLESGAAGARGTGLGLHISREMARKMGGDVWLETSEPGKGSTFAFSILRSKSEPAKKVKGQIEEEVLMHPDQKSDTI